MKKLLVIGLVSSLFSAGAFAAACSGDGTVVTAVAAPSSSTGPTGELCACNGGVAAKATINGGPGVAVATPVFVRTGFAVQCSANTIVSYNEVSGVAFAVASGSKKGNKTFKGSSAGGGIAESATCATTGCTGANVTTANGVATTDSSS